MQEIGGAIAVDKFWASMQAGHEERERAGVASLTACKQVEEVSVYEQKLSQNKKFLFCDTSL